MELTIKDIYAMIGIIKSTYSYAYKDCSADSLKLMAEMWHKSLSKYDKLIVDDAFQKTIETCKMSPTLADILENINKIKTAVGPSDIELWNELTKVIDNVKDCIYYYQFNMIESNGKTQSENARDRFNDLWLNLSPLLKSYCGNKNGLVELTEANLEFEKTRFLKILPSLRQRIETIQTTDPRILKLFNSLNNPLCIEDN